MRRVLVVALAASVTMLVRSWEGDFRSDELLYAAVAKRIALHGGWLDLHLGDDPYWRKPPLVFWLVALAFRAMGVSSFAARLLPALLGVLTCVLLFLIGRRLVGERAAFLGALILATTPRFVRVAAHVNLDTAVTACTLAGLLPFVRHGRADPPAREASLVGLSWGLAIMAKSLFGLLGAYAVAVYVAGERGVSALASRAVLLAVGVAAATALPWHVVERARWGRDFVRAYLGREVVQRMAGHLPDQVRHVYLLELVRDDWPWIAFTIVGLVAALRRARDDRRLLFLVAWPLGYLALLHLSAFRAGKYLVHLYPAASLLAAIGVEAIVPRRWLERVPALAAPVFVAVGLVLALAPGTLRRPSAQDVKDLRPLVDRLSAGPDAALIGLRAGDDLRAASIVYLDRDVHDRDLADIPRDGSTIVIADWRVSAPLAAAGFVQLYANARWALYGPR